MTRDATARAAVHALAEYVGPTAESVVSPWLASDVDAKNPANPVKGGGASEVSATLMAGFGLVASVVQLCGYAQAAGGIYACVQTWVLWRFFSSRQRTSRFH